MNAFDRISKFWADLHPLAKLLLLLPGIAIFAWLALGPVKSLHDAWRSDTDLAEARRALAEGHPGESRELAIAAFRRQPGRPDALPVLLRAFDQLNDPRRSQVALTVLQQPDAPFALRAEAWEILCRHSPASVVESAWALFAPAEKDAPAFLVPMADRLLRGDRPRMAIALIDALEKPLPAPIERIRLECLLAMNEPAALRAFQSDLIQRIRANPDRRDSWLELLDGLPRHGISLELATFMASGPAPSDAAARLRVARCAMAVDPGAIPSADLDAPSPEAEVFRLQLQLLEALDRPEALGEFLAAAPPEIPDWEIAARLAALHSRRGDDREAKKLAGQALQAADGSALQEARISLARLAERLDLTALATDAWVRAVIAGTGALPRFEALAKVVERLAVDHREAELLAVLRTYRIVEPGNPVVIVQGDYLAMLTGSMPPSNVIADLTPVHEALPGHPPTTCILALAHLLDGDPDKAVSLIDDLPLDWSSRNASYRAIRGVILAAAGHHPEAAPILEELPWKKLLPAERRTLRTLLRAP